MEERHRGSAAGREVALCERQAAERTAEVVGRTAGSAAVRTAEERIASVSSRGLAVVHTAEVLRRWGELCAVSFIA